VWKGYPVEGYYDTYWLMELWSTQARVESIMLKAAWHWGSNSSVANNYLGEPGHIQLYVCLSCMGGAQWMVSICFLLFCGRAP